MTTPHAADAPAEPTHPWAEAWSALSPQRRAALHSRIVDREPIEELAGRLGRTVADTEALVASTLVAFRREVVLGIGTGYGEECGSLVLRLVDSAGERLDRGERRALASHADGCPQCAAAVGELLEMDARLRDGLIALLGGQAPAAVKVPAARTPLVGTPARRRLGLGVGLAVAAVTVGAVVVATTNIFDEGAVEDIRAAFPTSVDDRIEDSDVADAAPAAPLVRLGSRTGARAPIASRTPVAVDAATAAPQAASAPGPVGGQAGGEQAGGGNSGGGGNGGGGGGNGGGGGTPGDPGDPGTTPPLDVAVDAETGSVTLTVGLLGDPIVISTPPITQPDRKVNKR